MRGVFENSIEIWRNINLKCSKCDIIGAVKLYTSPFVQLLFQRDSNFLYEFVWKQEKDYRCFMIEVEIWKTTTIVCWLWPNLK